MKKILCFLLLPFMGLHSCTTGESGSSGTSGTPASPLPSIVMIYCDDLGYGDLGCFGNTEIRTPNINRLATQGMKFTEFYSASPVCSPSRAALLTGRIPQRMGINSVFFSRSYTGMPLEEITIANVLKERGYTTGIVGKWHLGHRHEFLPLQRGFDEYFGIPYSNDMNGVVYLEGNEVAEHHVDQHYTTSTYTEKAVDFIHRHADGPFFLYLAHSMPHVPIYASPDFDGRSGKGLYTDVIEEIDWSVGEVLDALEEHGIRERTLVVFSSDNGPWLVMMELGGTAGVLREGKQYTFEGGQRVPTLAMWPGVIPAGSEYHDMGLMMDWFPTFAEIAGAKVPGNRDYDGENLMPVLKGQVTEKAREFLYYNGSILRGYRNGDWKLKLPFEGYHGSPGMKGVLPHDTLLFNLKSDPGEQEDLSAGNPGKVAEMVHLMEACVASKGPLPPSLPIGDMADHHFYQILRERHGPDYWRVDW
jgi:arylsulfatase A